ncbi:hypothetical protein ACV35H_32535, partial [Pseudomonas aeruginosa]
QPELLIKLSPRNGEVREVAQRIEIVELPPLTVGGLEQHLAFRFERVGKALSDVIDASGLQAGCIDHIAQCLANPLETKRQVLFQPADRDRR